MYYDLIVTFIYELINKEIKIWVDKEKVNLFIPEKICLTEEQKKFLKNNKDSILQWLKTK